MRKSSKITLLTLFIIFCYNGERDVFVNNNFIESDVVNIKTTTKIIKSIESVKPTGTSYDEIHNATWYNLHGHQTASGERFHKDSLTAAYNSAKFGTYLKVTNVSNNESIIVKVTDRMGNKTPNRIDLSLCAFDSISKPSSGRLKVKLEEIKKPL
jgi:rare lipoprotein A